MYTCETNYSSKCLPESQTMIRTQYSPFEFSAMISSLNKGDNCDGSVHEKCHSFWMNQGMKYEGYQKVLEITQM